MSKSIYKFKLVKSLCVLFSFFIGLISAVVLAEDQTNVSTRAQSLNNQNFNSEKDPNRPGGEGTTKSDSIMAFSLPHAKITKENKKHFVIGKSFFRQNWVTIPSSVKSLEGLGPTFIARSCVACHVEDGRGAPPAVAQSFEALLLRISVPGQGLHGGPKGLDHYGDQIQNQAIPGVKAEGRPTVEYTEIKGQFADGQTYSLLKPNYKILDLAYGELPADTMISPRIAPSVFGLGLLEAIDEKDILGYADEKDQDHDGISGRPNYVWDFKLNKTGLGRFGWKANQPSLEQQDAGAFLGDMGITTPLFSTNNCPSVQVSCVKAKSKSSTEISEKDFRSLVIYSHLISVPQRRTLSEKEIQIGEKLMTDLKCTKCHIPSFKTSDSAEFIENRSQWIFPYTDLLLHDMGPDLADGRTDYLATGTEWKTPPLWGIGMVAKINKHTRFLHDGRARSIEEAILWHGGEAESSKESFKKLSSENRKKLIQFVEVL